MTNRNGISPINKIARIAILGSLAAVLMLFEFPLPFAPSFMGVDLSDIPIMLSSITFGPITGVVTSFVKIAIKLILKPTSTAFIGELSNLFLSIVIAVTVGIVNKKMQNRKGIIVGSLLSIFTMSFAAFLSNAYVIYPLYASILGYPIESIVNSTSAINFLVKDYWTLMFFMVIPFNIIKQTFVSILSIILIKRIEPILKQ